MIGSAAGFCQTHKMAKMFVGTDESMEPTCVKCMAAASPKLGKTQVADDPGEKFFNKNAADTPIVQQAEQIKHAGVVAPTKVTPMSTHLSNALNWLKSAPMPADIRAYKNLQKAIKILESLETTNG